MLVAQSRWVERVAGLDLPALRHVLAVDAPAGSTGRLGSIDVVAFDDAVGAATPHPLVDRSELDPVYVMYTSGTSGPSKGAIHSNRSTRCGTPTPGSTCSASTTTRWPTRCSRCST